PFAQHCGLFLRRSQHLTKPGLAIVQERGFFQMLQRERGALPRVCRKESRRLRDRRRHQDETSKRVRLVQLVAWSAVILLVPRTPAQPDQVPAAPRGYQRQSRVPMAFACRLTLAGTPKPDGPDCSDACHSVGTLEGGAGQNSLVPGNGSCP